MRGPLPPAAIDRRDRKRGFTDADVIALIERGVTARKISTDLKASYGLVRRIARKNGHQCYQGARGAKRETDWPDEAERLLGELWFVVPKISCEKIGERLGYSKGAIIGKAGRMNLPMRPCNGRSAEDPRVRKSNAEFRQATREKYPTQPIARPIPAPPPTPPPTPPPAPVVVVIAPPPPVRILKTSRMTPQECCWPIGEPGKRGFRYCDAPAAPRAPYCDEHCREGYSARRPQEQARA